MGGEVPRHLPALLVVPEEQLERVTEPMDYQSKRSCVFTGPQTVPLEGLGSANL